MKRVFLAIDLSSDAKSEAAGAVSQLKQSFGAATASWVRNENFHLTLKFFGDLSDERIGSAVLTLSVLLAQFEPFTVSLGSPAAIGRRVLAITVEDPNRTLICIYKTADKLLGSQGFESEKRAFRPHVTIARIRDVRESGRLISEHRALSISPVKWSVPETVLYASSLQPTGAIYSRLHTFQLGS